VNGTNAKTHHNTAPQPVCLPTASSPVIEFLALKFKISGPSGKFA
jgi:hypothetical protein